MKLYYIAYAKMPTEKAHGIHIAKTCEAFAEQGIDVTLVVPNRKGSTLSVQEFYGLRRDITVVRLSVIDLGNKGPIRYRITALSFVCSYVWYLWTREVRKESLVYTVDIDHFSFLGIPFSGLPYFSEIHGGKKKTRLQCFFLSHSSGIIATTPITGNELKIRFRLPDTKVLIEPNGVDTPATALSQKEARRIVGIDESKKLVLYVGRVIAWKGIDILPEVANALPGVTIGFLGATREEYEQELGIPAGKLEFYGSVPHAEVSTWLYASDACLVLGTPRDEYSFRYTSPMKVFEYLASGRPVLASRTPALLSVLTEEDCYFFEPDSATDTVRAIQELLGDSSRTSAIAIAGMEKAKQHTWFKRAERIIAFMKAYAQV